MDSTRVVLADDHQLFREGTRELLERGDDIRVVGEAPDGLTAIAVVDACDPDVVVMDIEMPGVGGIEATRRIKAAHPRTSVLALTVHDEDQFVFAVLDAGAAGYLLKDVSSSELVGAVRALRAGESVLHASVVGRVLARLRSGGGVPEESVPELPLRELEVLRLAACGRTNQEIADVLGVSTRTVQLRLSRVFDHLGVGSRIEAVIAGLRTGLLDLEQLA